MAEPDWFLPLLEAFEWTIPPPPTLNVAESELKQWILEALPELTAHMEESEVKELIHLLHKVETVGTIAHVAEFFMKHGSALGVLASRAAMVGELATIASIPLIMYDVFTTGLRVHEQKGYCFGLMREALGLPDVDPRPEQMGGFPMSEGELEAWREGMRKGREEFRNNPELRKSIIMSILYEHANQPKDSIDSPEDKVLNRIWEKVHEDNVGLRDTKLDMDNPGYQHTPTVPRS